MTRWAIYLTATGELVQTFVSDTHPRFNGFDWQSGIHTATAIADTIDPAISTWSTTAKAFAEDAAKIEAQLIAKVKADNEARVRTVYSMNYGKQKKYARKQQEVLDFRDLPGTLGLAVPDALTAALSAFVPQFNALSAPAQAKRFRFAMAEAAARGVSITTVIGEWEATIDTAEQKIANWEAVEQKSIKAIKAAATAAGKRAVYSAITWPS